MTGNVSHTHKPDNKVYDVASYIHQVQTGNWKTFKAGTESGNGNGI